MNIYKRVQIVGYAVFLSLIINGNLYSSGVGPLGLRCELDAVKAWNEDEKKNLQQAIGLKGARYTFLVPEKVKYYDDSKRYVKDMKQACYYKNKILSVRTAEYDSGAGEVYFYPHFTSADRDEYNYINVKAREYRLYVHEDTSLKPVFIVTSFFGIRSRFRYDLSAITSNNQPYYFVLIIKKRHNKQDEVYSMKIMP